MDIGWRDFFVDPRLQQIVEIALKNNRDLRVSMLNVAAARAQYQITRAGSASRRSMQSGRRRKQRTPKDLSFFDQTISNQYSVGRECVVGNRLLRADSEPEGSGARRSIFALAETRKAAEISLVSQVADQYLTMLVGRRPAHRHAQHAEDGAGVVSDHEAAVR